MGSCVEGVSVWEAATVGVDARQAHTEERHVAAKAPVREADGAALANVSSGGEVAVGNEVPPCGGLEPHGACIGRAGGADEGVAGLHPSQGQLHRRRSKL
jgi:hypothetical protein